MRSHYSTYIKLKRNKSYKVDKVRNINIEVFNRVYKKEVRNRKRYSKPKKYDAR